MEGHGNRGQQPGELFFFVLSVPPLFYALLLAPFMPRKLQGLQLYSVLFWGRKGALTFPLAVSRILYQRTPPPLLCENYNRPARPC